MTFFKRPAFIVSTIVLVLALSGYFYFWRDEDSKPEYIVVERGNIIQEVSVTGKVNPLKSADLAFEKSGKIVSVFAQVGTFVYAGDILVREDSSELATQLLKAQADLAAKKVDLDKSQVVLVNYYLGIVDVLNDAHIKTDDAVRKQAGSMFTDAESDTPRLNFSSTNSQAITDSQNGRLALRTELSDWRQELSAIGVASSNDDLFTALIKSKTRLSTAGAFLANVADALEKATGITQSTLDSYKASITTARTNVNTALTNISDRNQNINSQKATTASEEAAIKSYEASIQNIEAQLAKTALRSPIAGVVTKQDAKIGEIASAGMVLVSVISATQFEVEANIPEIDIAKIKIGNPAKITLDAYGSDVVLEAKVTAIDPAETVIEGVSTYKTTLQFNKKDERIKSGMTGDVKILSSGRENVIVIPQRAVVSKNGDKIVRIIVNDEIKEVKVATGLRGSDGNIEITEGVSEGDKVIVFLKE